MTGLIDGLNVAKKSISKEVNLLLESINKKIDKDVDLKKKIVERTNGSYEGVLNQMTISYECRDSDYRHNQYILGLTEECKLEVCLVGCGNSEVDPSDIESCIEIAIETASSYNIKNCLEFLIRVNDDLEKLYV